MFYEIRCRQDVIALHTSQPLTLFEREVEGTKSGTVSGGQAITDGHKQLLLQPRVPAGKYQSQKCRNLG